MRVDMLLLIHAAYPFLSAADTLIEKDQLGARMFDKIQLKPEALGSAVEPFCQQINQFITEYNAAVTNQEKVAALNKILACKTAFEDLIKPSELINSPEFREKMDKLWLEIRNRLQALGEDLSSHNADSTLSFLIGNMSPDKANALTQLLLRNKENVDQQALLGLYPSDDHSSEAKEFRNFIKSHKITYLGGNNSINFKVEPRQGYEGRVQVLKIANPFNQPSDLVRRLRRTMPNYFLPVYAERSVTCDDSHSPLGQFSGQLQVVDFCEQGSVYDFISEQEFDMDAVLRINLEMIDTLLMLESENVVFSDAKNVNWLRQGGRTLIGDSKSLATTDNLGNPEPGRYDWVTSHQILPREISEFQSSPIMHPHVMGTNMLEMISIIWNRFHDYHTDRRLQQLHTISQSLRKGHHPLSLSSAFNRIFDLRYPQLGKAFRRIEKGVDPEIVADLLPISRRAYFLQNNTEKKVTRRIAEAFAKLKTVMPPTIFMIFLAQDWPSDRTTIIAEVNSLAESLESGHSLPEEVQPWYDHADRLNAVMETLKQYQFGEKDVEMRNYIVQQLKAIHNTPADTSSIIEGMAQTAQALEKSKGMASIINIITTLDANETHPDSCFSNPFTVESEFKAGKLRAEISKFSIEDRVNLANADLKDLKEELARHRAWVSKHEVYRTNEGEIDESKAAISYRRFMQDLRDDDKGMRVIIGLMAWVG